MPDRHTLAEAGTVTLTETTESGTALVTLITPGVGSSGSYSADVLESAATRGVFAAGTHMYLDHPTPGERPERSLDRLAGVLTEAATWDGATLSAPAKIYPRFRSMLADMQDAIGVSIRAGGVVESGVVQSIDKVASVDFVTKAGRGGSFALVESAVLSEGHGMTANDLSAAIDDAVRDAYGSDGTYVWVRDYTDEWAVFTVEAPDESDLWQQTYTVTGGVVTLTGTKAEVNQVTTYVPAPPEPNEPGMAEAVSTPVFDALTQTPAPVAGSPSGIPSPASTTEESLEVPMPDLTEADVQAAVTAAVALVEAERDEARRELADTRRRDAARPIVTAALSEAVTLRPSTVARLVESLVADAPALTDGNLDTAALTTAITAARTVAEAEAAEYLTGTTPAGVFGLGSAAGSPQIEESLGDAELDAIYAGIYPNGA